MPVGKNPFFGALVLGLVAFASLACSPAPAPTPTGSATSKAALTVTFFDVGDSGDGFLISTSDGKTMLVDGGRRSSGISGALRRMNVSRLDVIVATNPDADHIGGLIEVLKTIPTAEVWLSGDTNTTITFEDFIDAIETSQATVRAVRRGEAFTFGPARVTVLNPVEPLFSDRNNNSVALRMEVGTVSLLLTGDMEERAEKQILTSGMNLKSTILKLGHHGSRTSTSPEFLAAVQPEVAVYQAGTNNRFGHPHQEVLDRLAEAGVKVHGTGQNGVITISTDGQSYEVKTERGVGVQGRNLAGWISERRVLAPGMEGGSLWSGHHPAPAGTELIPLEWDQNDRGTGAMHLSP